MRIVVDLQACQTEASAGRGVGRYSFEFARHLALARSPHDLRFALNAGFPESAAALRRELAFSTASNRFSTYSYPDPTESTGVAREFRRFAGEALVISHWMSLQPDVLHVSHVFEGFGSRAVVPEIPNCPGVFTSTTLYDLIPLRFPDLYLVDPGFKQWYLRQLGRLRQFDLLLAISDSARQDAIELLGISPERVVTIWGGVGAQFREHQVLPETREAVLKRCGLSSRFVLYTGGDDHRKNIRGLIRGYSMLPAAIRKTVQLAIVCSIQDPRRAMYLDFARDCGLRTGEVAFTGFVSEHDLVVLYNLCEVFVFPSLYEGFGLPVVEAMACGAPVLGSNNSSIREILDFPDALFDPEDGRSIAGAIERVLTDPAFALELRQYGRTRVECYSWASVASRALDAFERAGVGAAEAGSGKVFAPNYGRKRLAVFTPLPPCRSGIADYNAAFLPFLKKHFDIEIFIDDYEVSDEFLLANFAIRSHREFDRLHANYDAVLYEIGNSEFHAYMLEYLERYPGVVGLHDAYLSGLFGYLDYYAGQTGRYLAEMLAAHTNRARQFFAPAMKCEDPVFKSMIELPATKGVLDKAIGVISHSPFNREVSEEQYPERWSAPFRVIQQMVLAKPIVADDSRFKIRRRLGYADDDFVIATFGHVAWTKMGDLLLSAFETCSNNSKRRLRLAYVGELAGDEFGQRLSDATKKSRFADRISITGFLSAVAYEEYLSVADIAVQLRKNSRGGTPKGVLDCLAAGVPVVVNNDASYRDYPSDVVCKLPATPQLADIADAILVLSGDECRRHALSAQGRSHTLSAHAPDVVAESYANQIGEFVERQSQASIRRLFPHSAFEEFLIGDGERGLVAKALFEDFRRRSFSKQRLLVDVTHISTKDHGTGIQRVVRGISKGLACSNSAGFEIVFVSLNVDGRLVTPIAWLKEQGLAVTSEPTSDLVEIPVRTGDLLLMLDSSWGDIDRFLPIFQGLRESGGRIVSVVFDILPLRHPEFFVPGGSEWFRNWFERAVTESDGLVCISKAVADDVAAYLNERPQLLKGRLRIGWWHLGADFAESVEARALPDSDLSFSRPTLLMVGTLEPRKGHQRAIDAMEILWSEGEDIQLCIVGRLGWMVEELLERIRSHPESGKRLFFLEGLSDHQLCSCYREAAALLIPSYGEGFGLPLIEAAHYGTRILASDLPVFREVAGSSAFYVRTHDASALAEDIAEWLALYHKQTAPSSTTLRWLTWRQSADRLLEIVARNDWCVTLEGTGASNLDAAQ